MKASKPGNIFSISVMGVSLWVFWCCLFGRGSVSWIRGSSFLMDVRTLVWLRLTSILGGLRRCIVCSRVVVLVFCLLGLV
jgi:hypothetical protein